MTHEELEKAVSLALDMHISGHDENDIREMDLDGEYSDRDLNLAFEVRTMVFQGADQDTNALLVAWAEYVLEAHNQGFKESYGGIHDFGLYLHHSKED